MNELQKSFDNNDKKNKYNNFENYNEKYKNFNIYNFKALYNQKN